MTSVEHRRQGALIKLGEIVVADAARRRHPLPDSDLYNEQPVGVSGVTTLGVLRAAGLGSHPDYNRTEVAA